MHDAAPQADCTDHCRRPIMRAARNLLSAALALVLAVASHGAGASDARMNAGSGSFEFPFVSAGEPRAITVWYHRPESAGADAPLVFVMHGASRNPVAYRQDWMPLAEARGFIVLAPEFSKAQFPGTRNYNLGNVAARDGTRFPEAQWSYTAIEDIFDAVRKANALTAATYDLYGHSAGGQFVHRLVLLKPDARYRVAVAANPGWYMMPDFDVAYPYGLKGAEVTRSQAAAAFGRRLIVLLGDADNDPNHHQLARAPEAMRQGAHRFERGQAFFERARRTAAELKTPFAWALVVAPGVAHSNRHIAAHAAAAMAGN